METISGNGTLIKIIITKKAQHEPCYTVFETQVVTRLSIIKHGREESTMALSRRI